MTTILKKFQYGCDDCKSENLNFLVWVDKNANIVLGSSTSENGEYWCEDCQELKYDEGV